MNAIYKIKCDERLFVENYKKFEDALKVAQELADSCKFVDVKIIEFLPVFVTEVKRKPLYKNLCED